MRQLKTELQEQRIPKFVITPSGCEVISNDESVKVTLSRSRIYIGVIEGEVYTATYYVKEGVEYEKCNTTNQFQSIDEFMRRLDGNEDYSEACLDFMREVNG